MRKKLRAIIPWSTSLYYEILELNLWVAVHNHTCSYEAVHLYTIKETMRFTFHIIKAQKVYLSPPIPNLGQIIQMPAATDPGTRTSVVKYQLYSTLFFKCTRLLSFWQLTHWINIFIPIHVSDRSITCIAVRYWPAVVSPRKQVFWSCMAIQL